MANDNDGVAERIGAMLEGAPELDRAWNTARAERERLSRCELALAEAQRELDSTQADAWDRGLRERSVEQLRPLVATARSRFEVAKRRAEQLQAARGSR
jgi:hypothetical protein